MKYWNFSYTILISTPLYYQLIYRSSASYTHIPRVPFTIIINFYKKQILNFQNSRMFLNSLNKNAHLFRIDDALKGILGPQGRTAVFADSNLKFWIYIKFDLFKYSYYILLYFITKYYSYFNNNRKKIDCFICMKLSFVDCNDKRFLLQYWFSKSTCPKSNSH